MSSPICIERSGVSSSITAEFLNKSIRFENTFLSLKQETLESTSKPIKQGQSNPNYCSINQASNSEYNSVPTVRNTSLKSNSRILSIDLTNTNPKVSIPNCKSPNDDNTKRKLLVASSPKPQTPDRSRIGAEMNYSRRDVMEKTQSYFGDTSSIGNNSSLIRAEDFQIKLKDELKKIEQRYKNGLGNNQIGVSFIASSEANHQNASILSNAGLNVKKEFGDILGNWKEVNGIRVEETARNKKIEQIKMLIQDKPLGRGVEVSEKNEMEEQAKLRKKAKLNKIQENLDKIEVEIIPFDIVSNKETIDYNLSDNEGSLSRRDSRSQSVKKQDDVPRVITPLETAKDENIFIDRSSRRKEEKDHSCKEERTRNKELPIPQKKDRTPVSAYQDKKKSQKENQIQKEKIMRNLLIESFLVLFEKKFDLVSRVRRRSYFKLIFYTIKQKHQIQLEKERNNHSHEILKMIAEEYLIQTSARLRNFITDMRCIKIEGEEEEVDDEEIHSGEEERNSDREIVYEGEEEYSDKGGEEGGQNRDLIEQIEDNDQIRGNEDVENDQEDVRQIESEEKVGEEKEMRENDDVEENLNQGAESPTNNVQIPSTRLDEFRVRRLLIIAKTIIFQKLYISNHEFFTKFKTKSERLKKKTIILVNKMALVKLKFDKKKLKYSLHRIAAFGRLRSLFSIFKKFCLFEYFTGLKQFNHDRSLLACTASEISMVRDESIDISHKRGDQKYHLAKYINTHFIHPNKQSLESRPRSSNTGNGQNTLEEIRHELSGIQGKKFDDISDISKKSERSKRGTHDGVIAGQFAASSDREGFASRLFSNEKLKHLNEVFGGENSEIEKRDENKRHQTGKNGNLRTQAVHDKLLEIQLADNEHIRMEDAMSAKKEYSEGVQHGAIMFETFKKTSNGDVDIFRKSAKFGEGSIPAPGYFDFGLGDKDDFDNQEMVNVGDNPVKFEKIADLFKKKGGKDEMPKRKIQYFEEINSGEKFHGNNLSPVTKIDNIESNLTQVERIFKDASMKMNERSDENKIESVEPSDDILWAEKRFNKGLNFIDTKGIQSKHKINPGAGQEANNELKDVQKQYNTYKPVLKDAKSSNPSTSKNKPEENSKIYQPIIQTTQQTILGKEGKPPMAYTKTQESFKSFFKKLDSDRKEIKLSSSVSRERKQPLRQYQSGIVEEKLKLQKPPINTHLEIRTKTPKPNSERVYASISTVRPKSNYIKPTPGNLSAKAVVQRPNSGSLAERLEKRINHHRDNYRNKGNKMRNEISNQSSLFSPDITDLYRSEQSLPKSKPQSKPANQESNSRASNGSEEKTNNLQKPSIKIKQESKIHLESFQATPKKPPIEKSKSFHQVVSPKLLCNKSGDITTQINRMNTTVQDDFQRKNSVHGQRASFHNSQKSIRSSSAKSDASKKIDTSNEKYKERYAAVRQDTKRSSYVKLAEAKKNYKDPPLF